MGKIRKFSLPKESELVVITKRDGKDVAVSPVADKGLKKGGLCIHVDPASGKTLMCERFKNTLERSTEIEQDLNKECLGIHAEAELEKALYEGDFFTELSATDPCPVATVLRELSKATDITVGVSVCPGYAPPKGQALLNTFEVRKGRKK